MLFDSIPWLASTTDFSLATTKENIQRKYVREKNLVKAVNDGW